MDEALLPPKLPFSDFKANLENKKPTTDSISAMNNSKPTIPDTCPAVAIELITEPISAASANPPIANAMIVSNAIDESEK